MKKVSLLMFFILFGISGAIAQDQKTIVASYDGYDGTVYSFMDADDQIFNFDECDAKVLKTFDLNGEEFIYDEFKITYTKGANAAGDTVLKIVKLEMIVSEQEEDEDY